MHLLGDSHLKHQSRPSFHPFLQFAWANSAFYRELYRAHGIREGDLEHITLQDLPVITKLMVLDAFDDIVTDPLVRRKELDEWLRHDSNPRSRYLGKYLALYSSRSTGKQSSILYDEIAWRSMTATAAAYLYPEKIPVGARYRSALVTTDRGHVASTTTMMNSSQATFDRLVLSMTDPIEEIINYLNAFQPNRLTSFSGCMGWLAGLALDGILTIAPKDVVVSADRMTPAIESRIRQAWNPNIYNLYASVESLFTAIQQPGQDEWKIFEDLVMLEVLNNQNQQVNPGEAGQAVLTNWTNRTLPLIRYNLNDYVICGETQPGKRTLRGFAGRTYETLPVRRQDGQICEIPAYALVKSEIAGVDALQFISNSPDDVEVQYCGAENMDEVLQARMAAMLADWGGEHTRVSVQRVDHIWNHASSFKLKLVCKPGEPQLRLPEYTFSNPPADCATINIRHGGGFMPFSPAQIAEPIPKIFERQVSRSPEAISVKDGRRVLTYAALNLEANRVAHALLGLQMDTSLPVVLLFSHNANMITAMLGVLKAGGWYAPLDPAHPEARNTLILQEIGARLVLTDAESLSAARLLGFGDEQTLNLDELDCSEDCADPCLPSAPDTPACILYTSGSTGRPKGVILDQRAVLHRAMVYTNDYFIGADDRMTLTQSYVFNASVREIYGALLNGAGLYIYSLKRDGVHHLADWLEEAGITTLYLVPATFRVFLDTLKGQRFEHLRLVRLGGEAVLKRDLEGFQRHFDAGCILANGLAATETGTFLQFFMDHRTRIADSRVPAGFPIQDKTVSIMNADGCPAANGETGEIVVASTCIGPGYFSPPGSGAVPSDPGEPGALRVIHTGDLGYRLPDGCIVLVGRVDWQIKLRGQRMNLLEIEQALLSIENVAEAAVTLQTGEDGTDFLAAFIQTRDTSDENALRQGLRALLPEAMVPSMFQFIDNFPHTATGKVDREALPRVKRGPGKRHASALTQPAEPLTPVEQVLAGLWCELLGIEQVGIDDRFFDLGGDSLKASALMAHIEDRFNLRLPLSLLFQHEVLRDLAAAIATGETGQMEGLLVSIQPLGDKTPVFFIPGIGGEVLSLHDLAANLGNERPLYGLQGADFGDSARNFKSIEQAAAEYADAVRTVQPHGPYNLAGYSFGGHLALEIARRLATTGEGEPRVLLIDTYPPVPRRNTSLVNRIKIHYTNLRQLKSAPEIVGYIRGRLQQVYLRLIRQRSTRAIARQLNVPDSSPAATASFALAAYTPQSYLGKVVLFKANQREWYENWDPMDAWQEFISGELDVRNVPGGHFDLVKNPYALELARQLKEALA